MTKNTQRQSQLVSTFGPGAMVDLPTRSVIVAGLDYWEMRPNSFQSISEARLSQRLERLLKDQHRLAPEKSLSLRTPPVGDGYGTQKAPGVLSPSFPRWFVCERVEDGPTPSDRRRRLVPWQDLDIKGRRKYAFDDGKKSDVTPIRFVCACEKGHLQDINWRWVVHGAATCHEIMWLAEKGTSADPADTSVVCGCGKRLSLQDLFQKGRLGKCVGQRPWLLDSDPDGCDQDLKLLTRTATNTYFPQVLTVISLPSEEDDLTMVIDELFGDLVNVTSVEKVGAVKLVPKISAALGQFNDADIFDRLQRIREGALTNSNQSPKLAEEVSCLYGFTRFEAAPTSTDGDIEDIQLAVHGAPISKDADWLPAIELFGEGLFIHFDHAAIMAWLDHEAVREREQKLLDGYGHWAARFTGKRPEFPGTPYVLLHSLSHALMQEIALDCGYPASSLKERVYALRSSRGAAYDKCGVLIYTASTGAQGTLGGLVGVAPRFANILQAALRRLEICSNDPICADHEPDERSGDRATHGAACHGCLLIAETSCESRNLFLDRALLVRTMRGDNTAFFEAS
jgi:hypothetical protein